VLLLLLLLLLEDLGHPKTLAEPCTESFRISHPAKISGRDKQGSAKSDSSPAGPLRGSIKEQSIHRGKEEPRRSEKFNERVKWVAHEVKIITPPGVIIKRRA
jgi:hypothetical protein